MPFTQITTFGLANTFTQSGQSWPQQIEAGDFNGDGIVDFLVTRTQGVGNEPATFRLMIGDGSGQWLDQTELFFTGALPTVYYGARVAVGDFNGDGKSDVYVPDYGPHDVWVGAPDPIQNGMVYS